MNLFSRSIIGNGFEKGRFLRLSIFQRWVSGAILAVWVTLSVVSGFAQSVSAAGNEIPNVGQMLDQVRRDLELAKELDAKKQLPNDYRTVADGLAEAEELLVAGKGTSEVLVQLSRDLSVKVAMLVSRARFVKDVRSQKHSWEVALSRFDHSLEEIALATGVPFPSTLSGTAAAAALRDTLSNWKLQNKLRVDSLTVASRKYAQRYHSISTEHDSIVTALEISISNLRRQLWDTELRAGMAEADKSVFESDLNQRREREQAIQAIQTDFGPEEGELLLTPEGDVIIRVFGFSFAVGSAELNEAHEPLMNSLAAAVARFPGAGLRIEGHTDNTGGREINLRLSRRRAETVSRLLLERLEQRPESVETVGFGPDRPLATNSTTEGRARNRRIDVIILAGGS